MADGHSPSHGDGDEGDGALLPHSLPTSAPHDQRSRCSVPSASITDEALLAPPGPHSDQQRGVRTEKDPSKRTRIVRSIEALWTMGKEVVTTGPSLSGTWRLLWTTEKEQLFIVKIAGVFGTEAGDVLQVIDVEGPNSFTYGKLAFSLPNSPNETSFTHVDDPAPS